MKSQSNKKRGGEKIKILCFLDDEYGRDVEIVLPVIYFAEKYLNCKIEFDFVWDAFAIYRKRPDLVFVPNTMGSPFFHQVTKYAWKQNTPVFALISEGNFRTDGTFNYWGYNIDKYWYQEYICLWSERTFEFFVKELPTFRGKMVFTGATGFDRYKIYEFESRESFLKRKNLPEYSKIITYAGWAFGKIFNEQGRKEISYLHKDPSAGIQWMTEQMHLVEDILRKVVENNPDILFILKRHPNEANPSIIGEGKNEMVNLKQYPNVLYITEKENIHDLINVSDIWMGFETTTALEAWLLKETPTILINPDPDFYRDKLYRGSLIVNNYKQLQDVIKEFYSSGKIEKFETEELKLNRYQLIKDTIGFGDGYNHIRAGHYLESVIDEMIENPRVKCLRFNFKYFIRFLLMKIGILFYSKQLFKKLPKFRKAIWIMERHRLKNVYNLKNKYWKFLDTWYRKNRIRERFEEGRLFKEILPK